ncbi:probable disease resistance protein At5g66900 isoform X2 [Lactuca sativa]|uniref:RPW8 domain-containing protein n=1 Tax=Lactuca sativa TaxID=4236 RepID=A0A9R1UCD7_LACSA|nr:probable disease resistance protein At5g66900 isoform X2 [Lactuca sativa]KAJ0184563.1 hypothetical protein LSAT_V11C900505310 [Lactuca sativa]
MAGGLFLGAVLGVAVTKLSDVIIDVLKKPSQFSSELTKIRETITRIKPIFDEIEKLTKVLDRPKHENDMFIAQMKGAEALILKCKRVKWNLYKRYSYALKLDALNKSMLEFFRFDVQLVMVRDQKVIMSMMKGDSSRSSCRIPSLKGSVIGFEDRVRKLKEMVLKDSVGDECSVVVVSAPGGCGKTTLVTMLCHDPEIKENFGGNIYFATISDTPNLKIVIKNLLERKEADFINDDDAINQWGSFLGENGSEVLLVLDDVWPDSITNLSDSIINRFKFNLKGYKILATSRITFTEFNTYQLKLLNEQDATTLFNYSAFSEHVNEYIPYNLVDKLVKCCKKHPLTLSVIGGLLKGKPLVSWRIMLNKLSDGQQSVLDLHQSIEHCLARSLDVFEEESVIKQCYMDLGLFPEDEKISATMLMDIWVHLYNHDEHGFATIERLLELSYSNLATLLPIRIDSPMIANYCEEKAVIQHDLMRMLAIRLSSQEPIEHRKRLIINANGQDLPQLPHTINATILSITTDERFSLKWDDIRAPQVEVFVLNFMSKVYHLQQFMQTMKKLKVLIITNYGYNFSDLQNFPSPQSLSCLTTIRLEHVSISSISTSILGLENLRKMSLIMCKIGDSFDEYIPNKLTTTLSEMEIDSCDDLITFPSMFCNLVNLRKLIITNCHELSSLTEGFGNLTNLEVLRLASCSDLKELPESMRNMQKMRVIDLSDCLRLKKLPWEIGELSSLRMIHMRGCTGLHELPLSFNDLGSLEVVCDEEIAMLWRDFKDVNVQLVEEDRIATLSKIIQRDVHV